MRVLARAFHWPPSELDQLTDLDLEQWLEILSEPTPDPDSDPTD